MTFDEYQKKAMTTALNVSDDSLTTFLYRALGFVGEAGEVAEKAKKIIRDKGSIITPTDKQEILKEMGDVLWYMQALAEYMDASLEDVAKANLEKLASRKERNALHGDGDNR